jgi:flagellin-specific chaperone FliS
MSELDDAIAELERTADRLRAEDMEPAEAAELVERCAQIAARLSAALDRQAAAPGETTGQERLL